MTSLIVAQQNEPARETLRKTAWKILYYNRYGENDFVVFSRG